MPLEDLDFDPPSEPLDDAVEAGLAEAERRLDLVLEARRGRAAERFIPADARRVLEGLAHLEATGRAPGSVLLEWGSGIGVVAGLSGLLGYDPHGIEIDPGLVDHAEALAERLGVEAHFAAGTFVPAAHEELWDTADDLGWQAVGGPDGYELLDLDPEDVDVVYAFPWPGEDEAFARLFARIARPGALLLTYHGMEDLRLRRKR